LAVEAISTLEHADDVRDHREGLSMYTDGLKPGSLFDGTTTGLVDR
jgi:hypothetical protein